MLNRVRQLREQRKLTQTELATLVGVDETAISRWESGARALTPRIIERLAQIFKIESWELLTDQKGLRRLVNEQKTDAEENTKKGVTSA